MKPEEVTIGVGIVYVDPLGRPRPALVTQVWGSVEAYKKGGQIPGVNLVVISDDEARDDSYGRQIQRYTSVCHQSVQPAHGNYWRTVDATEPLNPLP